MANQSANTRSRKRQKKRASPPAVQTPKVLSHEQSVAIVRPLFADLCRRLQRQPVVNSHVVTSVFRMANLIPSGVTIRVIGNEEVLTCDPLTLLDYVVAPGGPSLSMDQFDRVRKPNLMTVRGAAAFVFAKTPRRSGDPATLMSRVDRIEIRRHVIDDALCQPDNPPADREPLLLQLLVRVLYPDE